MFLKKFQFIFLLLIGLAILYLPPLDLDYGWHYKYGEYFVQNQRPLKENVFSFTMPDYNWANSYFIPQVLIYILGSNTNNFGVGVVFSLILTFTILSTLLKKFDFTTKLLGVIAINTQLNLYTISVRPLLFSSVFLFILLYILLEKRAYLKFLPILFMIWANTHADFTMGLFILSIFSFFNYGKNFKSYPKIIALNLACLVATFINVEGLNLWKTLINEIMVGESFNNIQEFLPIFSDKISMKNILFFSITTPIYTYAVVKNNDKKNIWYTYTALIFLFMGIKHYYFLRIFYIIGSFSLVNMANMVNFENKHVKKAISVVLPIVVVVLCLHFFENMQLTLDTHEWTDKRLPYKAIEYVKKNPIRGNVFNRYGWGGFMIWQLPEYKTYIDGRMPSWKKPGETSTFEKYLLIQKEPAENINLLKGEIENYDITWAMLWSKNDELINQFTNTLEWEIVYKDEIAVVLVDPNNVIIKP